jgi:hypothetical protein
VEVDLLGIRDTIAPAGVEEVAGTTGDWKFAYILCEQERAFTELPLDDEGGLSCISVHRISWRKEIGHHPGDRPTLAKLHGPRELQVGLHARTGNRDCTGRQPDSRCHGKIDLFRNRADLPLDGRGDVGEPRSPRSVKAGDIIRQINQYFQTWRDAEAKPAVGAIEGGRYPGG